MGSLTMNEIKSMLKSLVGWGQNCFCSGLLFWASFCFSVLEMKMIALACVKMLFLSGIFIKFLTDMNYDSKLSTKRKDGHVIILLCSGEAEIPHNAWRREEERKKWGSETHGEDFPYIDSAAPMTLFCFLLPPPICFPSPTESGHLSKCRSKGQQASKLKLTTIENSWVYSNVWIYSSSDFNHSLQFSFEINVCLWW